MPTRDSLVYTEFFQEDTLLKAFYVDINAFAGQQVDRISVYAILPDSTRKWLGGLNFGNCTECVTGFALMHNGALQTQGVNTTATMQMWLQSFNQPTFTLPENLQTLSGAGRISGQLPLCAIGWQVGYNVYNSPGVSTTEFATHILCPRVIRACPIPKVVELDCAKDSLYLRATIPAFCFEEPLRIRWWNNKGWQSESATATLPLSGNTGVFYFTVEDDCCAKTDSVLIEVPPFANAGADQTLCRGASTTLAGTGGRGHFWETPLGLRLDSLLVLVAADSTQSGDYILHAFDENGCEDTDTLLLRVVTPPVPVLDFQAPCLGDTLVLHIRNDSAYARISWFDANGQPFEPPIVANFSAADIGIYQLELQDSFGCVLTLQVPINGSPPPELRVAIEESCDSVRIRLAPAVYDYAWANGQTGPDLATDTGGLYVVTVTDTNDCATIAEIEVPQPEGPRLALDVTQPTCPGDWGRLEIIAEDPNRPLIFSIDGGATYTVSSVFDRLSYGTYNIVVQDALGCLRELSTTIVPPDSMGVSLNLDSLEVRPGAAVRLEATVVGNIRRYQWLPRDIDSGDAVTTFEAQTDLNVRLIVEDTRGCRASDGFHLAIVLGEVYAPNAFSPNSDGVNDYFTLYSDNTSGEVIETLQIYNRWGNRLFQASDIAMNEERSGWDGSYQDRPVNADNYTYYAIIRYGNGARKILKGSVLLVR